MASSIRIIEKPDWISWDEIHQVIWDSHAQNRKNGIVMRYPSLPGDKIRDKIGEQGIMLVALTEDDRLVGTAAFFPKAIRTWFGKYTYAYCCFAAVLPAFSGRGIYKALCARQEELARDMGIDKMYFDTHEKNKRMIKNAAKAGYRHVDLQFYSDHFNVAMVKWLTGCPYPDLKCRIEYHSKALKVRIKNSFLARFIPKHP